MKKGVLSAEMAAVHSATRSLHLMYWRGTVNRYKNAISDYITHHNN